jgi:hypothetical protein
MSSTSTASSASDVAVAYELNVVRLVTLPLSRAAGDDFVRPTARLKDPLSDVNVSATTLASAGVKS